MREILVAVVLVTAGLAGCIGSAGDDPSNNTRMDTVEEAPGRLAFDGCREILGVWELAYEDVAPYLPPGFEPTSLADEDTIGQNASMHLIAFDCTEPRDASVIFPWLPVVPPDDLVDPEADAFRLMLPCIGDAAFVEVLQAWGAPCEVGDAQITTETETPAAATWAFGAQSPNLTVRLEGTGVASGLLSNEPLFQQFHVTEQTVCAVTLLQLEDHIHWEGHGFSIGVEGQAPFPVPDEPTSGLLALAPFGFTARPSGLLGGADGSTSEVCPPGQPPTGVEETG